MADYTQVRSRLCVVVALMVYRDPDYVEGDWSVPGRIEDVLEIVKGWDPRCAAVISKAPSCVDWKIIIHDPLSSWVSQDGRVLLIGDAAHPLLPWVFLDYFLDVSLI